VFLLSIRADDLLEGSASKIERYVRVPGTIVLSIEGGLATAASNTTTWFDDEIDYLK
jgi:hypothetical protein